MPFSALEPKELKVLKLLEQNQACLPKLITQGSQVNHLLMKGCFLTLTEDHYSLCLTISTEQTQGNVAGTTLCHQSLYSILTRDIFLLLRVVNATGSDLAQQQINMNKTPVQLNT